MMYRKKQMSKKTFENIIYRLQKEEKSFERRIKEMSKNLLRAKLSGI